MTPRAKSALLWGVVGFLSVLVLVQGAALVADPPVTLGEGAAIAVAVGAGAAATTYALEHRIAAWAARRRDGNR